MNQRTFETTGSLDIQESIDLDECKTDPIHRTALVQPHGVLLQLDTRNFKIRSVSENAPEHLDRDVEELLDAPVRELLDGDSLDRVRSSREASIPHPIRWSCPLDTGPSVLSLFSLGEEGSMGLEIEPRERSSERNTSFFDRDRLLDSLRSLTDRGTLFDRSVDALREQTGFDRVMLYRFNAEGHGEVVAESRREGMGSYLGQQFPASDIPEPARRIYRKTDFRLIPRVEYEPVPVRTASGPVRDLDLTHSTLRNVPVIHRQYLKNMRVNSSFSVPVMTEDRLWGLIACHSEDPHRLGWERRLFSTQLGRTLSSRVEYFEAEQTRLHRRRVEDIRNKFLRKGANTPRLFEVLAESTDELLDSLDASGFYLSREDQSTWLPGAKQEPPQNRLLEWIGDQLADGQVLTVRSLEEDFDEDWSRSDDMSGFLAANLTSSPLDFCVWFRPQRRRKITWGGDPREPAIVDESGRLNPRNSFEEWTQIVSGQCRRWTDRDRWTAEEFVHAFNQISLREQHDRIESMNRELQSANEEKDRLMQEMHHRVKNNFQVTLSLVNIHKQHITDEESRELLEGLGNQLHSLASLHDFLSASDQYDRVTMSDYLGSILENLRGSPLAAETTVQLETNLSDLVLPISKALPCALIVNELVSNALEHAEPAGDEPTRLRVSLREARDGSCELSVRDNGPGLPQPLDVLATDSLGLKIVKNLAEGQLNGSISTEGEETTITVRFKTNDA